MSIGIIWTLLRSSWIAKWAALAMGVLTVYGINNHFVAKRAIKKLVHASKIEGKKRNVKAAKLRDDVRKPGAADRLRRAACRDC